MKHIRKQSTEPAELTAFKQAANEDWKPTYQDLTKPAKQAIATALMQEQGYICCYCESRIAAADSHIEHLIPQDDPTCNPLDYGNMLCSCLQQARKGEPLHCGHAKGNRVLPITPLEPHCEQVFAYTIDGHIRAAANGAAETIKILRLDIPKLRAKREEAITPFLDANLSPQEFNDFVIGYLQKDVYGRFNPFYTTIENIFAKRQTIDH